jgi:hypothetical protein
VLYGIDNTLYLSYNRTRGSSMGNRRNMYRWTLLGRRFHLTHPLALTFVEAV